MRNVASIDFNGYNLTAPTLNGFVDNMPDLAIFHANSNNFSGTVPDLTKLPYFYELDVSNNKLMGSFPTTVLPLSNLTFLDLRFNQFSGCVPPKVFDITLDVLFINNNNLNQPLPDELGRTTAAYLTLANNRFTGPIPSSIGQACDTLIEVLFLNNLLSGCLPYEIGLLTKATVFDAGTNQITGPIPLSFGCLMKVEQLNLAQNLLYGEVPDVVCLLADFGKLANLSLSSNYFTSLGASCLKLIKRGILDVRRNCIPWLPDQRSPEKCDWFLKQRKYCPILPYIPCHIPWGNGGGVQSAAAMLPGVDGDREKAPEARYTGYSALHNGHGP
ncbi:putative Leucine-rich repeat extensin-like protein 4 [Cocos nucifera]|nr:putative Leucine-rich repeat extensin-like protein 4 [Cocos nucifera]